jgi:Caspase domain
MGRSGSRIWPETGTLSSLTALSHSSSISTRFGPIIDRVRRLTIEAGGTRATYSNAATHAIGESIVPLDLSKLDDTFESGSGTYYALVIGNDEYAQLRDLETASNDARSIGALLKEQYGFKVTVLVNASRADILRNMGDLRRKATNHDSVLIYYAGHRWFDEGTRRGYWLLVEATEGDSSNWVSAADLTDILRAMAARHVMIVADSCHSGSLTRGIRLQSRDEAYLRRLANKRARVVLTSGGLEPVTDSGDGGHSVFARAFLDTLQANDGVLEGVAVFNQLRKPVVLGSDQTPEYGDIRFAGHEGGDFPFIREYASRGSLRAAPFPLGCHRALAALTNALN